MNLDPQSYQALGWLGLALFGLAAGVNQIMAFVDRMKGKPPAEQLQSSYQQLSEKLRSLEGDVRQLRADIGQERAATAKEADERRRVIYGKLDELRKEVKEDVGDLHTKINAVDKQVGAIEKQSETTATRVMQIDAKIDRLLERGH